MHNRILCHGGDRYRHPGKIDFSSNCNCFGMPDRVKQAAIEGVEQSHYYPDPVCERMREAIAQYESVSEDLVLCGNGASELIMALLGAIDAKRVLLVAPDFYEYERALCATGSTIEYYYLDRDKGFAWDDALLNRLKDTEAECIIFSNPHNPTGSLMSLDLLQRVVELTAHRSMRLIVDECFMEFVQEYEKYSAKQFLSQYKHLVILKAFTKTYACPGLRIGYLLSADEQLIDCCSLRLPEWNLSLPAQYAAIAAAGEKEWLISTTDKIRKERVWLSQKLQELGLTVAAGMANYIFFSGPEGLYEKCLKCGFLIRSCANYRGLSEGDYRICVRGHEDNVRLLEVLAREIKKEE